MKKNHMHFTDLHIMFSISGCTKTYKGTDELIEKKPEKKFQFPMRIRLICRMEVCVP